MVEKEIKQNMCFRIVPSLVKKLDDIGKKEYRSRSNLMYLAVTKFIDDYEKNKGIKGY
jgi:metal-responsive CopG/Arc/MetJ family transcriptional regulator